MSFICFISSSGSIVDKKDGGIQLGCFKSSSTFNDDSGDEDLERAKAVTVTLHIFVGIVNRVDRTGILPFGIKVIGKFPITFSFPFSDVIERLISDIGHGTFLTWEQGVSHCRF